VATGMLVLCCSCRLPSSSLATYCCDTTWGPAVKTTVKGPALGMSLPSALTMLSQVPRAAELWTLIQGLFPSCKWDSPTAAQSS